MDELSPYRINRTAPPFAQPPFGHGSHIAEEFNFKEYWRIVRNYRVMIYSMVFCAAAFVLAWYFAHTPQYKATSIIMIQPQTPQVISELKDLLSEQSSSSDYDYYKTQFDLLKSDTLIARVIHDFDLQSSDLFEVKRPGILGAGLAVLRSWLKGLKSVVGSDASPPDATTTGVYGVKPEQIKAYTSDLTIEPRRGTRLVVIGFTSPNPVLSALIANAHVQTYIRVGMELHVQTGKTVEDFLQQKLADLKDKVESSEAALNTYRRDRGIVTLENEDEKSSDQSPLMQRMSQLNTDLSAASSRRITLETQHQLIAQGKYYSLPEVISNPVVINLKEQIAQLSTQYASMINRYNPGYHPLDDLKARLNDANSHLAQESQQVAQGVEAEYTSALTEETKLAGEIEQVKQQTLALNDASLQEAVLERQFRGNRQLYESVLQKMNEISVGSEVPNSNVSIVDGAVPPRKPYGPGLLQIMLFACSAAAVSGIALAFFLESLDDTLKTAEDVSRYLGLPNFGMVPDFVKLNGLAYGYAPSRYLPSRKRRAELESAENDPSRSKEMIVAEGSFSTAAEVYRTIRTAIMFSRAGGAPKTILITSSHAGEGKTISTVNIATAFAHTGNRILIVDTDMRRSRCHEIFNVDSGQGLAEVLVRQRELEEMIHQTKVPGLSFLGAGSLPPNPSELLASPEMRALIKQLAETYDYVILDSAPIMPVSDSLGLSTMVDAVLVIAGGTTSRRLVREACGRLEHVGARILGVVLNKVDIIGNSYYRYDHYGYYRSYKPRKHSPDDETATAGRT